ncbi:hypothetical protein BGZ60DRAFT_524863 [Tricladium varicosporioides]|nr:hypothetical protein BGZ60DRAFT_524863 [Hymenoscyphus varicosporioides]
MDLTHIVNLLSNPRDPISTTKESFIEENLRLRRALCALTRNFISTSSELSLTRKVLGIYKTAFPFLQLPREVRDQIYTYALTIPEPIVLAASPLELPVFLTLDNFPSQQLVPNLCLANKKIQAEANEILYSKNTFHFPNPSDLYRFEEDIGPINRTFIHSISIDLLFPSDRRVIPHPDLIANCDFQPVSPHWSKVLDTSRFMLIDDITVNVISSTELGFPEGDFYISRGLKEAIRDIFERDQKEGEVRRLTLRGFYGQVNWRFPKKWIVKLEEGEMIG